ncbi:hypothetical protein BSKO_05054 [Bryopsis sp. KO-2023]|nr:hypothetical protein BSKO_05054 [Bryopsis sp. KO-2023]
MVDLQNRVQELEQKVSSLTRDREQLYKDMEKLLMQSDSSFWSGSSVLFERISHAESERDSLRAEVSRLQGLVNNLREDVTQLRDMKRAADAISKEEIEKNQVLEKELAFYKQRGAVWIEDRNLHLYEVEELSRLNVKLEGNVREAKAALDSEREKRVKVEEDLVRSQRKNSQMESRLAECSRIPELERKWREASEEVELLTREGKEVELELEKCQDELEHFKEELDLSYKTAQNLRDMLKSSNEDGDKRVAEQVEIVTKLKTEVAALKKEKEDNSMILKRADEALTAAGAQAELLNMEKEREVEEVRCDYEDRLAAMKAELERMTDEKDRLEEERVASVNAKMEVVMKLSEKEAEISKLRSRHGGGADQNGSKHASQQQVAAEQPVKSTWW